MVFRWRKIDPHGIFGQTIHSFLTQVHRSIQFVNLVVNISKPKQIEHECADWGLFWGPCAIRCVNMTDQISYLLNSVPLQLWWNKRPLVLTLWFFSLVLHELQSWTKPVQQTHGYHTFFVHVSTYRQVKNTYAPLPLFNVVSSGLQFTQFCFHKITTLTILNWGRGPVLYPKNGNLVQFLKSFLQDCSDVNFLGEIAMLIIHKTTVIDSFS